MLAVSPSLSRETSTLPRDAMHETPRPRQQTLKILGREVAKVFSNPVNPQRMSLMSVRLQQRYLDKLSDSTECMLPSFNHTLPGGQEDGTHLALDVGGSTLRIALVQLRGRSSRPADRLNIIHMSVSSVNNVTKQLSGTAFFDWMAVKISEMLADCPRQYRRRSGEILPLGLSWSFPIHQTSLRAGRIQCMGKGFCSFQAIQGQDLGGLIVAAGRKQGLNLRIAALVNDSCASLLSRAYLEPSTSMSLILGTGTNMAIHLPTSSLGPSKLEGREAAWLSQAEKVTINTELSMFGKDILPESRWDHQLNRSHCQPNYQPLEYMTTGRYLGEILRLILVEAVETADLFDGEMPASLQEPYSLDTCLLAKVESDESVHLTKAATALQKELDLEEIPSAVEMAFIRLVVESISRRAAAYLAAAIHALWKVERKVNGMVGPSKSTIACNGSVIEKYPGFRSACETYIEELIQGEGGDPTPGSEVILQIADEAAVLGAAVAVATGKAHP
jgi:hexokinase